jgi:hypothetical protein
VFAFQIFIYDFCKQKEHYCHNKYDHLMFKINNFVIISIIIIITLSIIINNYYELCCNFSSQRTGCLWDAPFAQVSRSPVFVFKSFPPLTIFLVSALYLYFYVYTQLSFALSLSHSLFSLLSHSLTLSLTHTLTLSLCVCVGVCVRV